MDHTSRRHTSRGNLYQTALHLTVVAILAAVLLLADAGCARRPAAPLPGVSYELAQQRAQALDNVRYEVRFSIPEAIEAPIRGRETIRFNLRDRSQDLVIDFNQPADQLHKVQAGETEVGYRVSNGHIIIPKSALRRGQNALTLEFTAGESALNRNPDYLYTLFVPDRASTAFPCFDQPNLKARYQLTLDTPPDWRAVANGPLLERTATADGLTYRFRETEPISTYLFSFVAGKFQVETAVRSGRQMHMYYRETDAQKVARNRDAIFDLHEAALNWLEQYTQIPYPFSKFDFVLIPSFQYGGMEHPGAILYREASLLLDESATQNQKLGRASVIAHETSHMWFGDLVTMNWFDDVWTKEVFANFMAAKIVNPSFPKIRHDLRFLLQHYPAAYGVDRTAGANPIRQPLENLNMAGTLYGAIIYHKAPIVMRQLEQLLGPTVFRDGLRTYLQTYRYGNATWPDLISILDRFTDQDLRAWSEVWVEEPGRPRIQTRLAIGPEGRIEKLVLTQSDPAQKDRLWPQMLSVLLAYGDTLRFLPVQLGRPALTVEAATGLAAPNFVLANGKGIGYADFELDPRSRAYLLKQLPSVSDPLVRGTAWITLWEEMLMERIAPQDLIELGMRTVTTATSELNIEKILGDLARAFWRFTPPAARKSLAPRLEDLFWSRLEKAPTASQKSAWFNAFRSVALTPKGLRRLQEVWSKERTIPGLTFAERDYTRMALELAVRGVADADRILAEQRDRIQNPDRKARFEFVLPALSADPAVRDRFFASLADEANREHEPWVLEALRYLHHPLRAKQSEKYILPSLEMLEEIQRTGDIFFPKRWLDATFSGHQSPTAAAIVRRFLADNPDLSPRLRAKVLQSADALFRAARIVGE